MKLNAGDTAPKTAHYRVCDQSGKVVGKTSVKEGQTLPPTQQSGWYYEID